MGESWRPGPGGAREAGENGVSPDEFAVKAMADKGLDARDQLRPACAV
jgi:hypothetical protein